MSDAAEFFAKKKNKKKKAFKFNANNIDASTVTQTVHVDAPLLSTDNDGGVVGISALQNTSASATPDEHESNEQWDDDALASATARKAAVATGTAAELLDMKALDLKGNEPDDIAEKLRIEETRAQLAAAKEGMEKEAQRIKDEQEKKKETESGSKPRFGNASASLGAGGSRWVPPHLRAGSAGMMPRGLGTTSQKLDTQDEQLFPDLAAAEAILEQKKEKPAYSVPKKTPVGGGATWASKPKKAAPEKAVEETSPETANEEEASPAPAPAPTPMSSPVESKAPVKPIKKKKKKDLSTFKPSS